MTVCVCVCVCVCECVLDSALFLHYLSKSALDLEPVSYLNLFLLRICLWMKSKISKEDLKHIQHGLKEEDQQRLNVQFIF